MTTFTEQFADAYAQNAVPDMLKAINTVKRYNRFALLGALATSYLHQAHYLWTQGAGYFAYLVPLIFDAAMVSMLIVVRTPGITKDAKRGALVVFAGTALLSATVNFLAPGSLGLRFIFALVVVLVIGVELVAGRIRPDFAAIERQATELLTAARDIATKNTETATQVTTTTGGSQPDSETAPTTTSVTRPTIEPVVVNEPAPALQVPTHLLPTAQFVIVNHEQHTGRPITRDELATRMSLTPAVAGQLLATINPPTERINGTPIAGAR